MYNSEALDFIFHYYFVIHIPIAILIDSQAIFPKRFYPKLVQDLVAWYCKHFKDPMLMAPPSWYKSFMYCEIFLQLPFFFVAVYAFGKGINTCPWIVKPILIYATNAATATLSISFYIFCHDFSDSKFRGPSSLTDRLKLFSIHCPFLITPIALMISF